MIYFAYHAQNSKVMLLKTTKPMTVHYISVEVKIHSWKLQKKINLDICFERMRSHEIYDEWKEVYSARTHNATHWPAMLIAT